MSKDQPVIIVRRNKKKHGHHGGAWKVAYADFVTAMMAFFLVMWLSAQDSRIRDAVAGYFRDPGLLPNTTSNSLLAAGRGGINEDGVAIIDRRPTEMLEAEMKALVSTAEHIRERLMSVPEFAQLREQVDMQVTPEGLRIELVDRSGSSFFDTGSAVLRGESIQILAIIAREVGALDNDVVIEGHTDSRPYAVDEPYGNWELSTDRANAARRVMLADGLRPGQLRAVRGFADTIPRIVEDRLDPRNRRVSIVVRAATAAALDMILRDPGGRP